MIDLSTNFHLDRSNGWKVILSQTNRSDYVQNSFKAKTWASLCWGIYFIQVLIFSHFIDVIQFPENLDKSLETLSPYAVEVSRRLREGLTYTDVIKLYAEANEDLVAKQGIIEALQGDMAKIMDELKDVAPK